MCCVDRLKSYAIPVIRDDWANGRDVQDRPLSSKLSGSAGSFILWGWRNASEPENKFAEVPVSRAKNISCCCRHYCEEKFLFVILSDKEYQYNDKGNCYQCIDRPSSFYIGLIFAILIVRHVIHIHYSLLLAYHLDDYRLTAEIHPEPAVPWQAAYFRFAAELAIQVRQPKLPKIAKKRGMYCHN